MVFIYFFLTYNFIFGLFKYKNTSFIFNNPFITSYISAIQNYAKSKYLS